MSKRIQTLIVFFLSLPFLELNAQDKEDSYTSAHWALLDKVNAMRLDHFAVSPMSLAEVLDLVRKKAKEADPEHKGVNIIVDTQPKQPKTGAMSLDDISIAQLMLIICDQVGLQYVIKDDGIHLIDLPLPTPTPVIGSDPELREVIDKLNKDAYYKCRIITVPDAEMISSIGSPNQQGDDLKRDDTVEYNLRGCDHNFAPELPGRDTTRIILLRLLKGLKIVGVGNGSDVNIYWIINFYNKDGTNDEIDMSMGLDEGTWKGRKVVGDRSVRRAVKQIIARLEPPPLDN